MRTRIKRFLKQRTDMLAGVSHDLRTPLTRMKLQISLMSDEAAKNELRNEDVINFEGKRRKFNRNQSINCN